MNEEQLQRDLTEVRERLAALEARVGIAAAIGGLVGAGVVTVIVGLVS